MVGQLFKFWKKWINADSMDKIKLIKDLPITKTYAKLYYPKMDMESGLEIVATMLNSYFEDLLQTIREEPECIKLN